MASTTWLLISSACGALAMALIARSVGRTEGGPPLAPAIEPRPTPAAGQLRILTWNIAHGRGTAFHQALLGRRAIRDNLVAIGRALQREQPDLVALQEVDGPSQWSGFVDQPQQLAIGSGLYHLFRGSHGRGFGPVALDYGTAVLARWPLRDTRSVRFARSWRDNKGFVVASVVVPGSDGTVVDVVSLHLDFLNPLVRRQQVRRLVEELRGRDRPLIVVGDFNCDLSGGATRAALTSGLGVRPASVDGAPTFPATRPQRRLDWVLVSPGLEIVSSRTLPDALSDHRAVVADIAVPIGAVNPRREP